MAPSLFIEQIRAEKANAKEKPLYTASIGIASTPKKEKPQINAIKISLDISHKIAKRSCEEKESTNDWRYSCINVDSEISLSDVYAEATPKTIPTANNPLHTANAKALFLCAREKVCKSFLPFIQVTQ